MKVMFPRKLITLLVISGCLVPPPLAGIVILGLPIDPYLEFPPLTRYVGHEPFSWTAFVLLAAFELAIVLYISKRILGVYKSMQPGQDTSKVQRFPVWGWVGLALGVVTWVLAWSRFEWFESLQLHTFISLWLGYILVMNGLSYRRKGACLMTGKSRAFLWLFPLSAMFWWYFEYSNRFVQNWYYLGVDDFTPLEYIFFSTISFSTVLPAVMSTLEWLTSYKLLHSSFTGMRSLKIPDSLYSSAFYLLITVFACVGLGMWPDYLFPLIWIAPLIVIICVQTLSGLPSAFQSIRYGDWRPVFLPAIAALFCGFFWEMWNSHSLAHWEYSIPYGDRFYIFEMPLLGYAFYLPFGLLCLAIVSLFQETNNFFPPVIK